MPKTSTYTLCWLPEQACYKLCEKGHGLPVSPEGEAWYTWLAAHSAFAFQGQRGKLTLLKESRARGEEGYWYAYRSRQGHTRKKYLGRSSDLTLARLEETASILAEEGNAGGREQVKGQKRRAEREPDKETKTVSHTPLLAPKLHVPQIRTALIARERLLARMDAGLQQKLTLLCAPAGFGKTTLVSQWIAERNSDADFPAVAWVSLDISDNDPVRFWRYAITACQAFLPERGETALARLQTTPQPSFERASLETTLTIFLNELAQSNRQTLLILEDYHTITESRIHKTLLFLLDHLPATVRLLLITRADPALPLASLRAKGDLNEVRTSDLRFSRQEMEQFLHQALTMPLSAEIITHLTTRLEGWAAGLRLIALALQRQTTPEEIERFLTSLAGSHRSLLEYFVTEVLDAQPENIQQFLLYTSALKRLTGSLCDAITGRRDGTEILHTLARANLFLEALDETGEWYRYHALFAESMHYEARRRLGEEQMHGAASRASRWYEEQGQLAEAIESALQAQESERAAELIERFSESAHMQDSNEFYSLQRWFEHLPEHLFMERPVLCMSYVTTELFVGATHQLTPTYRETLERRLHALEMHARGAEDQTMLGQICSIRALVLWWLDQPALAEKNARQALALLPIHDQWRSNALSILAHLDVLAGRYDSARQIFLQCLDISKSAANQAFTRALMGMLGGTSLEQGLLTQAAHYMSTQLSAARTAADLDDICHGQLASSFISYEHNELAMAQQQAQEVFDIGLQLAHEEHQYHASLMLARIAYARGERDAALNQLLAINAQTPRSFQVYGEAFTWQARLKLASGDLAAAQRWAEARPLRNPLFPTAQYEREELLAARLEIVQGEVGNALARLALVLDKAQENNRLRSTLEAWILMALAYHADKQHEQARAILLEALTLARPEHYIRLFLDEGPVMAALLRAVLAHTREKNLSAYIQRLLQAFASEPGAARRATSPDVILLNEPLSQQERRVLRHLAEGRSNPEIARELVVSVNTVRTQIQSVYRKLNVNNRVAASELARELHLL